MTTPSLPTWSCCNGCMDVFKAFIFESALPISFVSSKKYKPCVRKLQRFDKECNNSLVTCWDIDVDGEWCESFEDLSAPAIG